jgi:hypothetical protein
MALRPFAPHLTPAVMIRLLQAQPGAAFEPVPPLTEAIS